MEKKMEVKVRESLEEHFAKKFFKGVIIERGTFKSIVNSSIFSEMLKYLPGKKIKAFDNSNSHNYPLHKVIYFTDKDVTISGLKGCIIKGPGGNLYNGNAILWQDLYIDGGGETVEDYTLVIEDNKKQIEKLTKSIEKLNQENEELCDMVDYMKAHNVSELNKDEYIVHKKLISVK
jgi:hypothetical protein